MEREQGEVRQRKRQCDGKNVRDGFEAAFEGGTINSNESQADGE